MHIISVDVGSSSVRVAIIEFDDGKIIGTSIIKSTKQITIYNPKPDFYEQKSSEIWDAVCSCVKECLSLANIDPSSVVGIGFSSTCSLVIVENGCSENDVIMWMDHRAIEEAKMITKLGHSVLDQFGSICSPEFTISKLAWLKRNQLERFNNAKAFMELPDWLAWKCANHISEDAFPRSLCSVVCKWGYDAERNQWNNDFLKLIGLQEFIVDKRKIGDTILLPGTHIDYMCKEAAIEMNLLNANDSKSEVKISVASPIIDAHAGVLAMLALRCGALNCTPDHDSILCLIAGTSTCHMILNHHRQLTKGVWGPYFNAIFPNYYLREAGQSATGKLIEHIIRTHPEWKTTYSHLPMETVIKNLNNTIQQKGLSKNKLNICPSFHGNRSPLANPSLRGGIYGLTLDEVKLVDIYQATIEALAYETKFIIEKLNVPNMKELLITGGLEKNELYVQIHADILQCEVITIRTEHVDMMLVGGALLAYHSANGKDLGSIDFHQLGESEVQVHRVKPREELYRYHDLKYKCYKLMVNNALEIEGLLHESLINDFI